MHDYIVASLLIQTSMSYLIVWQYAKQVCGIRNQPVRNVEKRSSEQFELQELRKRVRQLEADRQRSMEMVEQGIRDLEAARSSCSEQLNNMQEKVVTATCIVTTDLRHSDSDMYSYNCHC